jgi:DNA-binding transcriptional ArsR family regulator
MVTIKHKTPDAAFRAIADPTRREILHLLRDGPRTVGALASNFRTSRPAISKHLRLLRSAGLVATQKAGAAHLCHLNARPLRAIDTWLRDYEMFWGESLRGLKNYIEETGKREKEKNR